MQNALKCIFFNILVVALSFTQASAESSKPDLVIDASSTRISGGSLCQDDALFGGLVVIKNIGSVSADLRLDLVNSYIAVYVPQHPDLIYKKTRKTAIRASESRSFVFEVGRGKRKARRAYQLFSQPAYTGGFPIEPNWLNKTAKYKSQIMEVQRMLVHLAYDLENYGPNKDGVDGIWRNISTKALRRFQRNARLPIVNGKWNAATGDALVRISKREGYQSPVQPQKKGKKNPLPAGKRQVTVFAVVDPFDRLDEADESNNLFSTVVTVNDCPTEAENPPAAASENSNPSN